MNNEILIRTNLVLTRKLRDRFEKEAAMKCGGNMSLLFKLFLADRYEMPKEIDAPVRHLLEQIRKP